MRTGLFLTTSALCAISCHGYKSYQDNIPNGDKVFDGNGEAWAGVGHERRTGGGARNNFGLDFAAAGHTWTEALCNKDSDGDGTPNGVELGDPQCKWEKGQTPQFDAFITHPGLAGDRASTKDTCEGHTSPASSFDLDVKFTDYKVLAAKTTYVKQAIEIDFPAGEDLLITSVEALVDNLDVTHHMLLYACTPNNPRLPDYSSPNPSGGMPCSELVWSWAVGGRKFCFPDNINVPIETEFSHFMLEIHYDNPTLSDTMVDSSGLRLTVVSRGSAPANMKDAGFIWNFAPLQQISLPAGEELVRVTAPCTLPSDPQNKLPNGVNVIAFAMHAHTLGTKLFTTIQAPNAEPVLAGCEPRYDFDLQEFKPVNDHYKIMPGSKITTTCIYNTKDRDTTTYGGDETHNEMCIGIFIAYPKIPGLGWCYAPELETTLGARSSDRVCTASSVVGALATEREDNGSSGTLTGAPQWVEAHGFMMTIAWVVVIPLAIGFAVVFRHRTNSSVDWYFYHRGLVGVGVALALAAFVVAIVNTPASHFASTHGKLGLVTVILTFVQVVGALMRPHKEEGQEQTRARAMWEVVHWWTGRSAVVLAAAAVYTGYANNLSVYTPSASAVGIAMVGLVVAMCVALVAFKLKSASPVAATRANTKGGAVGGGSI